MLAINLYFHIAKFQKNIKNFYLYFYLYYFGLELGRHSSEYNCCYFYSPPSQQHFKTFSCKKSRNLKTVLFIDCKFINKDESRILVFALKKGFGQIFIKKEPRRVIFVLRKVFFQIFIKRSRIFIFALREGFDQFFIKKKPSKVIFAKN